KRDDEYEARAIAQSRALGEELASAVSDAHYLALEDGIIDIARHRAGYYEDETLPALKPYISAKDYELICERMHEVAPGWDGVELLPPVSAYREQYRDQTKQD